MGNQSRLSDSTTLAPRSETAPFRRAEPGAELQLPVQADAASACRASDLPPTHRFIRIAKNNRELSDVAFRLQIITTVDQIENMYWDLVYAYENQRVKEESLTFSQKTLSDTKKQVEIGSLAPIEAVRAQSTVAADQQALTVAKTNSAVAAADYEERAQPHFADQTLGQGRCNSDLHDGGSGKRTGTAHRRIW